MWRKLFVSFYLYLKSRNSKTQCHETKDTASWIAQVLVSVIAYSLYFLFKFCPAGQDRALLHTISSLEQVNKKEEAEELKKKCKRGKWTLVLFEHTG